MCKIIGMQYLSIKEKQLTDQINLVLDEANQPAYYFAIVGTSSPGFDVPAATNSAKNFSCS